MTTIINWITYDGTPETRPHSIKELLYDSKGWELIPELRAVYLLRPQGEEKVADQSYTLQPVETCDGREPVFVGWEWESRWPDFQENNITYPLTVGDMWAEWPTAPRKEA